MTDRTARRTVRVVAFGPTRPFVRPGDRLTVAIELDVRQAGRYSVTIELFHLDSVAGAVRRGVRLPVGRSTRHLSVTMPTAPRRGYGLRLRVARGGAALAEADAAVEALAGWWESPRHAAVTRFADPVATAAAVRDLAAWHVTVIQDYDWMYRHYRYRPPAAHRGPDETFDDALGRRVSHAAVRAGVAAGHDAGIATLAYGSVYGAEPEYVAGHPDERVFDDSGDPLSLGGLFFINDPRDGRPWRRRLLREYGAAVRSFGFDGIHMDTYGPPHRGIGADGLEIDFAAEYPGLIRAGASAVAAARSGGRVLFNCVEGFPIAAVGSSPMAAAYLELWPPDICYADLLRWIARARDAVHDRPVVIAAYPSCFREHGADPAMRPGAVESVVLLTSVIAAAGAYHHVLADGDRVLVEGYYPEARPLRRPEAAELQAAWVFHARYVDLLTDPRAVEVEPRLRLTAGDGTEIRWSSQPEAGRVWARAARLTDGSCVLHLVDLRSQPDDRWDAPRAEVLRSRGWTLAWEGVDEVLAASPWTAGGRMRRCAGPDARAIALPPFRRWLMVVTQRDPG